MINMGLVALLLGCLFFFMLLGFPLFMSMIFSPLLCMAIYAPQVAKVTVVQEMRNGIGTFVLLAVPMFILAADIMGHGEMADRLLGFVGSFVRHLPGGLALTTGATCTIFGAISGSTQATLVAIGRPMYKPLLKSGYSTSHTIALVMCNANIALLIPPSVAMIMYCVCTGVSVGDLFLCGFGPGIILFLGFAVYDVIFAKRHGLASSHKATWKERGTSFRRAILALGFPVIVLGGIYSGMFTPTEAATVAVFYALLIEGVVYRSLKLSDIPKICMSTATVTAAVFVLVAGGQAFSWIVSYARIPQAVASVFAGMQSQILILLIVSVFFFVACMFVDSIPVIIIMSPIILPVALNAGIDPLHLGIIVTLQSAIGCVTPPFGCNIFTACGIFHKPFIEVVKGLFPYMAINLLVGLILVLSPDLCMISYNLFH